MDDLDDAEVLNCSTSILVPRGDLCKKRAAVVAIDA
jgi:hypothetical protein